MNANEDSDSNEAVAHLLVTFLALADKGGVREGVAGLYRLVSAFPSAVDSFPTAMATIETWLDRESGGGVTAQH